MVVADRVHNAVAALVVATHTALMVTRTAATADTAAKKRYWLVFVIFAIAAGISIGVGHWPVAFAIALSLNVVVFLAGRIPELLLAAGMLTITFSGVDVGIVTAPDVFLLPALLFFIPRVLHAGQFEPPTWLIGAGALVLAAGLLPHFLFPVLPARSVQILGQLVIALIYIPVVISLGVKEKDDLWRLATLFVLSASVNSFFAVLQFFEVSDLASLATGSRGFAHTGRVAGFTAHPNQLGLVCVLAFPIALHLYKRRRLWFVSLVLLVGGVMGSGSRTALVSLLASIALYLYMQGSLSASRLIRALVFAGLVAVVASAVGIDIALNRLLVTDQSVAEATAARSDSLAVAFSDIRAHPLTGVGFGKGAHSLYISVVQSAGVLALGGFGWFATRTLRIARRFRHDLLVSAVGASMASWLAAGLIHPGLYDRYLYVPAGLLLGAELFMTRTHAVVRPGLRPDKVGSPE